MSGRGRNRLPAEQTPDPLSHPGILLVSSVLVVRMCPPYCVIRDFLLVFDMSVFLKIFSVWIEYVCKKLFNYNLSQIYRVIKSS